MLRIDIWMRCVKHVAIGSRRDDREVEHGISLLSIDGRGAAASTMSQLRQRWRIQWARANCAMAACIRRCRSAEQVRLQEERLWTQVLMMSTSLPPLESLTPAYLQP